MTLEEALAVIIADQMEDGWYVPAKAEIVKQAREVVRESAMATYRRLLSPPPSSELQSSRNVIE